MTALTDPLAEGAVQAVLEAGTAGRSRRRQEHPGQERDGLCHQCRPGGAGVSAGAPGGPGPGRPVHGRGAGQFRPGLTRPCWILDPVDGTTNLIHNSGTARSPWLGGGWTNRLRCGIQSLYGGVLHRPPGRRSIPKRGPIQVSAVSRLEDSLLSTGTVPGGGSWRTRRFARCGRCMTGARTSGGRAVPAWNCAGWPADGWRAMWSCLSSPGTTPPECSSWRRPEDRLPLLAAPPSLWRRVGLCWPPMGGSTAHCKQF